MIALERYFGLAGRVVLITGATRGIGKAMTEAFADAGASLVLASNEPEKCRALEIELAGRGVPALGVACDVGVKDELERLVDLSIERFGRIDVCVCNAGIAGAFGPMAAGDEAPFDELLRVNLRHPLWLSNLVAPHMAEQDGGNIVLTASIAGLRGNRDVGLYGVTKAALIQLARNLAIEWGPAGIRANAIAPGLIGTDWASAILANPEAARQRLSLTPLRRIGEPWEVAAAALFLASPAAGFITGHTLVVDGGTLVTDGN